jgi:hypothetical protein
MPPGAVSRQLSVDAAPLEFYQLSQQLGLEFSRLKHGAEQRKDPKFPLSSIFNLYFPYYQ